MQKYNFDESAIIADYYELHNCRDVAEKYNCNGETIRRILQKNNISRVGWKSPKKRQRQPSAAERPKLTEEEKDKIVEAYKRLNNQKKVAAETHHGGNTVSRVIKERGLAKGHSGGHNIKVTDEQIIKEINTGLTRQEIAAKYDMHVESLARRMHQIGMHAKHAKRPKKEKQGRSWEEYLIDIRQQAEKRAAEKAAEKEIDRLFYSLRLLIEKKTPKTCACCGETFYSESPNALYCSIKCRNKARGNRKKVASNYRERCKKYGVVYDPSVTRRKVMQRDGMICQICGKRCDEKSKEWGSLGADFPTIDHIIPLAKGGTHTWDNVQLACAICNSYKRDLTEELA